MREKTEKFTILPFSIGCVSHSSVAVSENQGRSRKARAETKGEESPSSTAKMKNTVGFLALPKPNISGGFQKIIKSIKSFSNLFMVYDDEEEEETEMEIGLPTDVRHIGHIGWDGLNNMSSSNLKSWDKGPDIFSIHSLSLKQFELAMDAHGDGPRAHLNSSLRHF